MHHQGDERQKPRGDVDKANENLIIGDLLFHFNVAFNDFTPY